MSLLLALWLWDICPVGEVPVAWRVEYVRRSDLSAPWLPTFVQESAAMQAEIPCEPTLGEVCIAVVTSLDIYGEEDKGESCG